MDRLISEQEIIQGIKQMGLFRTNYPKDKIEKVVSKAIRIMEEQNDFAERVDDILRQMDADREPVKEIPSAEPYKGMTNGEVMQKIFKGVIHHIDGQPYIDYCYENQVNAFTVDWWNSPYKEQERSDKE